MKGLMDAVRAALQEQERRVRERQEAILLKHWEDVTEARRWIRDVLPIAVRSCILAGHPDVWPPESIATYVSVEAKNAGLTVKGEFGRIPVAPLIAAAQETK